MPVVSTISNNRAKHDLLTRLKNLKSPRIEKMTRDKSASLNPRRVSPGKICRRVTVVFRPLPPLLSPRFIPVARPGENCKFLRIFTRHRVRKPNVDSRKSPGQERAKISERSQRFSRLVEGGRETNGRAAIDEIIVIVERGVCVLRTLPEPPPA